MALLRFVQTTTKYVIIQISKLPFLSIPQNSASSTVRVLSIATVLKTKCSDTLKHVFGPYNITLQNLLDFAGES